MLLASMGLWVQGPTPAMFTPATKLGPDSRPLRSEHERPATPNGNQMAPGDTTVGSTPHSTALPLEFAPL